MILVVDDNKDFALSLADLLGMEGLKTEVAFSGRAAINAASEKDFDGFVIDIGLPDMTGVDVITRIRDEDPEARCVFITGFNTDYLDQLGIDREVYIVVKPVSVVEILQALKIQ